MIQLGEKCTKWPQMTLKCSTSKVCTHMHTTYIRNAHIFFCFTLQWAVFELRPLFQKSAPNDPNTNMTLTCSRSKVLIYILIYIPHTPVRPNFLPFSLYLESFSSCGPILWKVHQMTPKWPWNVQGQNTHMHIAYTIEAQIIFRFAVWWAVFELWTSFVKCTKWPTRSKVPICILHTHTSPKFSSVSVYMKCLNYKYWEKCTEWPQHDLDMVKVKRDRSAQ